MLVSQRAQIGALSLRRYGTQRSETLLPEEGLPIAGHMGERLIRQLTLALDQADVSDYALEAILTDAIQMVLGRPENRSGDSAAHPLSRVGTQGLVNWRLGRVERYIRQHLHRNITLPELASAAGLSRMHFAKQFKATMGLRPHEYVLGRRIELAKSLMLNPEVPLVDVAMSSGFQSQSHFTTVFRRLVGETPHRWRCRRRTETPDEPRLRKASHPIVWFRSAAVRTSQDLGIPERSDEALPAFREGSAGVASL